MKSTLIILIAGLFLIATPLSAFARGNSHYGNESQHQQGWQQDHRGDHRNDRNRWSEHRSEHRDNRYSHRRPVVHRQVRWVAPRYERPVYASVPLILLPPRIIFGIGW